jgi:hypothetical protein
VRLRALLIAAALVATTLATLTATPAWPQTQASVGRGAREPLQPTLIVGAEGKGMFASAGIPPHDIFATQDFYKDRELWFDNRYYRCNSAVGLEQIWGAYEVPLIGDDPLIGRYCGNANGHSSAERRTATRVDRTTCVPVVHIGSSERSSTWLTNPLRLSTRLTISRRGMRTSSSVAAPVRRESIELI